MRVVGRGTFYFSSRDSETNRAAAKTLANERWVIPRTHQVTVRQITFSVLCDTRRASNTTAPWRPIPVVAPGRPAATPGR